MKDFKLSKDQIKKLALSTIGFFVLVYVYLSFFLGPLNSNSDKMLATIAVLQDKVANSKNEMGKATNLERQAGTATTRFAALKALSPEGAPIAWFPPRMKAFFANQSIDKSTARLETSVAFTEPELAGWTRYNWMIELPQADYSTLGKAVAALENGEPLLSINRINIRALPEDPQFQQVSLTVSTAILKR
ncbi:MAG: hypothetical protein DLM73_08885 [Chthoniobacterales bacterium]|nr:MAG: hypothetical protein DLM73_08885 [Chthoniobacterales bacterium]